MPPIERIPMVRNAQASIRATNNGTWNAQSVPKVAIRATNDGTWNAQSVPKVFARATSPWTSTNVLIFP